MTKMSSTLVFGLLVVIVGADIDYDRKLTKLWSVSGTAHSDGTRTSVVKDIPSASITVQPANYPHASLRTARQPKMPEFHPYNLAKSGGPFLPKGIPLMRNGEFGRSLDVDMDEEPIIEKPDEYVEQHASRRSLSSLFEADDEEDDGQDDDADLEEDEETAQAKKKGVKLKPKKYAKYMLPLLLAYKLKFFSMIPLMMGGLVLLVGATGMAGFFFALFAAVMGLQKGSY